MKQLGGFLLTWLLAFSGQFAEAQPASVAAIAPDGKIVAFQEEGTLPVVGDRVAISFTIPGLDERAARAEGEVVEIRERAFRIEIDPATRTGDVVVGDLVEVMPAAPMDEAPTTAMSTQQEVTTATSDLGVIGRAPKPGQPLGTPAPVAQPDPPAEPTLVVPDDHPTIQSAIDAATNGEIILVKAGVYEEFLVLAGKRLELRGEAMQETLVHYPTGATWGKADLVSVVDGSDVRIRNFTFAHTREGPEEPDGRDELVKLNGGRLEMRDCRLQGGGRVNGIRVFSGELTMGNCQIEMGYFGIGLVNPESFGAITDVTLTDTVKTAIVFQAAAAGEVVGAKIRDSGRRGIEVIDLGSEVVIRESLVERSQYSGIWFREGATGLVEKNVSLENGSSGIYIADETTNPVVKGNECRANTGCGIAVFNGAQPVLEGNLCVENKQSGICIGGAKTKAVVIGNTANQNAEYGIAVERPSYPEEFRDNIAEKNGKGGIHRRLKFKTK